MPVALETVVKQLADSGIIAPGKLENFVPPKAYPQSIEELVQELVKQKHLTNFQAQQVKGGKVRALNYARHLRRAATFPERLLWGHLRGGRLAGIKFRRQHTIESFVVDFYCHEAQLVIELDGDSHVGRAQYDAQRTAILERSGVCVVRVANEDVLNHLDAVLEMIRRGCGGGST